MRRRLTVAMVLMVVGTLVLAGRGHPGPRRCISSPSRPGGSWSREAQSLAVTVHQEAATVNKTDPARSLQDHPASA